ncbi:hypothetical protein [Microbacterium sp. SLBN-146]|uniref:hypothetical protein n=1 Tax=Microbacterium sp. SLBN-146 TaxID=2768457 RepID=UPI00135914D6|nr:hypothetical protein [Microbacterium sp. SLBN-146]
MESRVGRSSTPAWAAVAAWGAGLLACALGASAATHGDIILAVPLLVIAAAALAWGAAALVRGSLPAPRTAIAAAIGGVVAVVAALLADPARTSVAASALACALLLSVALGCGRRLRMEKDAAPPRLSVLLIAAVVVAGAVTPALGATEAGRLAPDHGSHGIIDPGHHPR